MSNKPAVDLSELVPGGIQPTDYKHHVTFDETCSRCRQRIPEDDVPLLLWIGDGTDMYAFCRDCNGFDAIQGDYGEG